MSQETSMFDRIFLEAPGDPPPDMPADATPTDTGGDAPPEMDMGGDDPDISDPPDMGDDNMSGDPPDLGEEGDFGGEDQGMEDQPEEEDPNANLEFDEKISRIMNMNLYQRYLALLNNIGGQLTMLKDNSDTLYAVSEDSIDIIAALKKLDENVRLYLKNYFIQENFSKNRLFFDKCLNLLNLLNEIFQKKIEKGLKHVE
jgi:hypothetical protein